MLRALLLVAQFIQPEDRTLISDFSVVTAVAATQAAVYAATPGALVIYDRNVRRWTGTVSVLDGYPDGGAIALAANPLDDTVWLATTGQWLLYRPFARVFESGPLPGRGLRVVLDRDDPVGGAWFETTLGWYFVDRGGMARAGTPPPPARRLGQLTREQLRRAAPALDASLLRIARDERLRSFDITAAAAAPMGDAVFVATGGNGLFRVDPAGFEPERLPAGLLGAGTAALALGDGRVCAGTDMTAPSLSGMMSVGRRGVTCLRDDLGETTAYEAPPAALVGNAVRAVAVSRGAVWAGSEAGLTRLGEGRAVRLTTADGLPSDGVRALALDGDALWVGTDRGLALVSDDDRPQVRSAVSFGAAVGALLVHHDTLWIGSALGLVLLPRGAQQPIAVEGGPALRLPVVDLAVLHDTLVLATAGRILWRAGGGWSDAGAGTPAVGAITAVTAADDGLWVAGTGGLAHLAPRAGAWMVWNSARDLPLPVRDIAARGPWVWLATAAGLVRLDRRNLAR